MNSLGEEPMDDDLNIASEIDLLVEIEDIQDELHILKVVLRDQKRTLRQLDDILIQGKKRHSPARNEGEVDSMIDTSCIEHHTARITEMEKLAEKAHESVSDQHLFWKQLGVLSSLESFLLIYWTYIALSPHRPQAEASQFL